MLTLHKPFLTGPVMRVLLALICFIAMLLHSLFGYFLYTKGENIFYPEQKQIEILSKTEINSVPKISDGLPASTTENSCPEG